MSYARFQNTLADLRDCEEALPDIIKGHKELSPEEERAKNTLIWLCKKIA
jgi:hypothetical protein